MITGVIFQLFKLKRLIGFYFLLLVVCPEPLGKKNVYK